MGRHRLEYFADENENTITVTNAFLRSWTPITDKGKFQEDISDLGVLEMNAAEAKDIKDEMDYSEAAHVEEEYEYLLKKKDQGITFEEYCRRRGIELQAHPYFFYAHSRLRLSLP